MKSRYITIFFTLLLLVQSSYILPFSLKEGFSTITLIALAVAVAPIFLLWVIYVMVRRTRHRLWLQILSGIVLCLAFEVLLPVSPFKTTIRSRRLQKAVDSVQISGVSDKLFYSPQGNPVGIRISFDVAFPDGGIISVSPTILAIDDRLHHYLTSMSHFANITIEPQPKKDPDSGDIFVSGQSYTFTADFLPGFLFISHHDEKLCLYEKGSQTLRLDEFKKIVSDPFETRYSVEIRVSGNSYFVSPRIAYSGSSDKVYSLRTFYESALSQRAKPCKF